MTRPVVAVLASTDPLDTQTGECAIADSSGLESAAQNVGGALARVDATLVVYTCDHKYLDHAVVAGYVAGHRRKRRDSIEVWCAEESRDGAFAERDKHDQMFTMRTLATNEWGAIFFRSMRHVDALVVLGGGDFTFGAGLWGLDKGKAVAAVSCFGGAGRKTWRVLQAECDGGRGLATTEDVSALGDTAWTAKSADGVAKLVCAQLKRRAEQVNAEAAAEQHDLIGIGLSIAATAILLVLGSVVFATDSIPYYCALLGGPIVAGVAGATLRYLWEEESRRFARHAVYGAGAALVSVLVFLLPQVTASEGLFDRANPLSGNRGAGLIVSVVLIGFAAGFTFELVYNNMKRGRLEAPRLPGGGRPVGKDATEEP